MVAGDDPSVKLLLVSDHRVASDVLTEYLSRHGFDVVARATTPAEAAAVLRASTIDVVLVDGDVAAGWRSVVRVVGDPRQRRHIAVLAAYWGQQERLDAQRCGVGATLLKRVAGTCLAGQLRALAA